jgi:hypothetical protein
LAFETDPSDVYTDLINNSNEIMVIDARTQEAYAQGHAWSNKSSLAQDRLIRNDGHAKGQDPRHVLRWNTLQRIHQSSNEARGPRVPSERDA